MSGSWRRLGKRAPRVALFADTYDELSGISRTYGRLAEFCRAKNYPLEIFTNTEGAEGTERTGTVKVHRFRPLVPFNYYLNMCIDLAVLNSRILSYFERNRFDIVHAATPGNMGINAIYVSKTHGLPLVGSYHTHLPTYARTHAPFRTGTSEVEKELHSYLQDRVESLVWSAMVLFYDRCDVVLAPSEAIRAELAARLSVPVRIFRRGVDTELFHPKYRTVTSTIPQAIYVGRVSTEKNLDLLAEVLGSNRSVRLVIVGDGPYRKELQEKLPRALFTGVLRDEALSRAYANSDFFVFPSQTDTFGNAVLEAQASGLPVVVTATGGPQELVEPGTNGFIAATPRDFAAAVDTLIRHLDRRREMGRAARQYALRQSWDAEFESLYGIYKSVGVPVKRRLASMLLVLRRHWLALFRRRKNVPGTLQQSSARPAPRQTTPERVMTLLDD